MSLADKMLPAIPVADVIVIGGGVIGMSAARELAKTGARVVVVDRELKMGHGCSYGNAGWITPCFSMPLPQPGMFWKSILWLLDPESPLYIKPRASFELLGWLVNFTRHMNQKHLERSANLLVELSKRSLEIYASLDEAKPGSFGFSKSGLLMVSRTKAGVKAAVDEMELVARFGVPGRAVSEAQAREIEPALLAGVLGGVYFPEEAHAEPLAVVDRLREDAVSSGAAMLNGCDVLDFIEGEGKIQALVTTRGILRAKEFVLAAGTFSNGLSRKLGIRAPILGGKGYALIVDPLERQPKVPMMLVEKKIAVTPRDGSLRLAGTMEIVGTDLSITHRRVAAIVRGSREFLPVPEKPTVREIWRGLRPCTPDGLPMIGRTKRYSNLVYACGHQMLGLQSGSGTGQWVAGIIAGRSDPILDAALVSPDRF